MPAVNLVLAVVAVALVALAVRGLGGAWPMQFASFLVLAVWVVAVVWAAINLLGVASGEDPDAGVRGLLTYTLVAAPVTGLGLAFLAFVKCGPVVVPRGFHALGAVAQVVASIATILAAGASAPATVLAVAVPLVWVLVWLVCWWLLGGRVDAAAYATGPATYRLPFPSGQRTWVLQGNHSRLNHNTATLGQGFAWDFRRPCGTPVLAALGGRVVSVIDSFDGIGGPNNEVEVEHADGSVASYLHVQHNSAQVRVGANVSQGDPLAAVGSVGNSLTGHVHFQVRSGGSTVPVRFADVPRHGGIPRGFRFYTSGNR
jgi:hypothetical protein